MKALFKVMVLAGVVIFVLAPVGTEALGKDMLGNIRSRISKPIRAECSSYLVKAVVDNGLCNDDEGTSVQVYVENYSNRPLKGLVLYSFEYSAVDRATGAQVDYGIGAWTSGPITESHLTDVPAHSTVLLGTIIFDDYVNRPLTSNAVYKVYEIAVEQYKITPSNRAIHIGRFGTCSVKFAVK